MKCLYLADKTQQKWGRNQPKVVCGEQGPSFCPHSEQQPQAAAGGAAGPHLQLLSDWPCLQYLHVQVNLSLDGTFTLAWSLSDSSFSSCFVLRQYHKGSNRRLPELELQASEHLRFLPSAPTKEQVGLKPNLMFTHVHDIIIHNSCIIALYKKAHGTHCFPYSCWCVACLYVLSYALYQLLTCGQLVWSCCRCSVDGTPSLRPAMTWLPSRRSWPYGAPERPSKLPRPLVCSY